MPIYFLNQNVSDVSDVVSDASDFLESHASYASRHHHASQARPEEPSIGRLSPSEVNLDLNFDDVEETKNESSFKP